MKNNGGVSDGVLSVVQSIIDSAGEITASELVEAARPESSPAHAAFEWNDAIAGEEYRLFQARRWLRVVSVKMDAQPRTASVSTSAEVTMMRNVRLVHVPPVDGDKREGYYKPITVVAQSTGEFGRALDEARRTMNAAKRAVDELVSMTRQTNQEDRILLIAQVARGMDMMYEALSKM